MSDPISLRVAETNDKDKLICLLDQVRVRIENGETVAIGIVELQIENKFQLQTAGDVSRLEMIGMLSVLIYDQAEACRK